jgi:hypothetical protein
MAAVGEKQMAVDTIRSAAQARPHCAYGRDATRPANWRFCGSSPSERLVGTALGRPHS